MAFLVEVLSQGHIENRYDMIGQIIKNEQNICYTNSSQVKMTLKQYKDILFYDSIVRPQNDSIKYLQYNSYLNARNVTITTVQFSKLMNCSYDYFGCDEHTLSLVGFLMIEMYFTQTALIHSQKSEFLNHIEQIYSHLNKFELVRQDPRQYPLASIVMASHNRDYYLMKSIQHVFLQTYVNWELLISDDGSSNPKTLQILQLIENHPRIKVFFLHTNQYAVFALNHAITQIRGEYLSIQDDDDIMLPYRLNYQIDFLKRNPNYEVCGSPHYNIDEIGQLRGYGRYMFKNFAVIKFIYMIANYFPHSTFTVRLTPRMKKHFFYNHQTAYDYSLWFKLLFDLDEDVRFASLPNYVSGSRIHEQRMTNDNFETNHYAKWIPIKQIEILEKLIPDIFENVNFKCFERTMVTEEQFEQYQTNLDAGIAYQFTKLLISKSICYHEDIILTNSLEIINPQQLLRFQKLNSDLGIFGLRPLSALDQQNVTQYSKSKIMQYRLFEKFGYQKARDFVIDPDIYKQLNKPAFEDKIQTLLFNENYLNVQTLKDAGIYIDNNDCRSQFQSEESFYIKQDISKMTQAEKRKLQYFFFKIKDELKSICYYKYKKLYEQLFNEL
ncbi:UNKNOWN [Stylonychia lemnae]|uniref:Glycosyltransferase 2-like domain-containing protein n=1 Tax=Stylonychia lemnae TaxID=5949 RepID=A0A077ZXZ6_STYLE|nr:UNKNOWN [Stylonychia lemnae]|eukprot:CDW74781.1 UNKNOWN [Stylonychia lemnae]